MRVYLTYKNKWSKICNFFKGKTYDQVKDRGRYLLKKNKKNYE